MAKIVTEQELKVRGRKKFIIDNDEVIRYLQRFFTEVSKDLMNFNGQKPVIIMTEQEIKDLAVLATKNVDSWEQFEEMYKEKKNPAIVYAMNIAKECIVRYLSTLVGRKPTEIKSDIKVDRKNHEILIYNIMDYIETITEETEVTE